MPSPKTNGQKARRHFDRLAAPRVVVPRDQTELPPHSEDDEAACLGAVLLAGATSQSEVDELLKQLRPRLFYSPQNKTLFDAIVAMRLQNHAVDTATAFTYLKQHKQLEEAGGIEYLHKLPDRIASIFQFPHHLTQLQTYAHRRWLQEKGRELMARASEPEVSIEDTQQRLAELFDATTKATQKAPALRIWTMEELEKFTPDPRLRLVGDNELTMGYEGIAVIAGPGSSGKSLCAMSLALAGAKGDGFWMGRKVHRQFKTLFIQAENGAVRLKAERDAMQKLNPKVNIKDNIFISDPPEGGLPFHNADFRRAVREQVSKLKPGLVVIDPWSQVASEDAAKDVVEKLGEIRSCFPTGADCPCLLIIAHTKKPRAEDVRRGRGLTYMVSGSVALPNTARTVYVLLPWSDDTTDDRIYWTCSKLNNGEMYAPSVWHRRFGTHFEHDPNTDPTTWGAVDDEDRERHKVTEAMLRDCFAFAKRPGMKKGELAKLLNEKFGVAESTAYRVIGKDGYAAQWLTEAAGVVSMKD
jgi:hypothetical protein